MTATDVRVMRGRGVIPRHAVAAATIGIVLATIATFVLVPGTRDFLVREDGPLENLTAAAFLAAFVVGVIRIRRSTAGVPWTWIVPAFGLVAFLDEIGFGSRLFGFAPPRIAGIDVDSLHDVFDLTERFAANMGFGRTALALIALGWLTVAATVVMTNGRRHRVAAWFRERPQALHAAVAFGLFLGAIGLDLVGSGSVALRLVEETLEFAGAGVLVFSALSIPVGEPT